MINHISKREVGVLMLSSTFCSLNGIPDVQRVGAERCAVVTFLFSNTGSTHEAYIFSATTVMFVITSSVAPQAYQTPDPTTLFGKAA